MTRNGMLLKSKDTNYISPDLTALELFRRKIFETSANQTLIPLGSMTFKAGLQITDLLWKNLL